MNFNPSPQATPQLFIFHFSLFILSALRGKAGLLLAMPRPL
jgi:hypothetical protein